jgi:hypothetical protein
MGVWVLFQKSDLATHATAAATLFLASATAWLAVETQGLSEHAAAEAQAVRDQVEATERQAEAVREQAESAARQVEVATAALEVSVRPWLTAASRREMIQTTIGRISGVPAEESPIRIEIVLVNVGNGLAFILPDGCQVMGSRSTMYGSWPTRGAPLEAVVAPTQAAWIRFDVPRTTTNWKDLTIEQFTGRPGPNTDGEFNAWVTYTDAGGRQAMCAQIQVTWQAVSGSWTITRIDYRRASAEHPEGPHGDIERSVEFA